MSRKSALHHEYLLRRGKESPAPDLFTQAVLETPTREIRGMVRGNDSWESQRAAVDVLSKCAWVKRRILEIIATEGAQTDGELELRPEFDGLGASTVRRRRTDLFQAGKLVRAGRRDKMACWEIAP